MPLELPVLTIADATAWNQWLAYEASTSKGVWLTLAKKGTTQPTSLTYAEALQEALCFGWIDGQSRRLDDKTWSQRFTPRAPRSIWSQRNVGFVAQLEQQGRMQPAGRAAVEQARADGRWEAAYACPADAELPPEMLEAIAAVPAAQATWDALNKRNRWAIYFRLSSLRTEAGRRKRMEAFVEMLARGEMPYPQTSKAGEKATAKSSTISKAAAPKRSVKVAKVATVRPERTPDAKRQKTATVKAGSAPVGSIRVLRSRKGGQAAG